MIVNVLIYVGVALAGIGMLIVASTPILKGNAENEATKKALEGGVATTRDMVMAAKGASESLPFFITPTFGWVLVGLGVVIIVAAKLSAAFGLI